MSQGGTLLEKQESANVANDMASPARISSSIPEVTSMGRCGCGNTLFTTCPSACTQGLTLVVFAAQPEPLRRTLTPYTPHNMP